MLHFDFTLVVLWLGGVVCGRLFVGVSHWCFGFVEQWGFCFCSALGLWGYCHPVFYSCAGDGGVKAGVEWVGGSEAALLALSCYACLWEHGAVGTLVLHYAGTMGVFAGCGDFQ